MCNAVQVEVNRPRADAAETAGLRLEVAELLQQVQSQTELISQATAAKIQAEVSKTWPAWKLHCFAEPTNQPTNLPVAQLACFHDIGKLSVLYVHSCA